jgi:hypothetical protein
MLLTSSALIAFFLSDFYQADISAKLPEQTTMYAEEGNGELTVSLDTEGRFGSIAQGASRIPLGILNLSASCDADIHINSIRLQHRGFGDMKDVRGVYLMNGFRRISRARGFDARSRLADLRIPNLVIPACSAVRFDVLADFQQNATVASEHGIGLLSSSDIQSTAKATVLEEAHLREVVMTTPKKEGTISVNFLSVNSRVSYGHREIVARIQFTADGANDMLLKKMTLRNLGDARDMHLINFTLENRIETVLTTPSQRMKGRYVSLEFSPTYVLERGKTIVLLLKANMKGSRSDTINFTLEEPSDLEATVYRPRR